MHLIGLIGGSYSRCVYLFSLHIISNLCIILLREGCLHLDISAHEQVYGAIKIVVMLSVRVNVTNLVDYNIAFTTRQYIEDKTKNLAMLVYTYVV